MLLLCNNLFFALVCALSKENTLNFNVTNTLIPLKTLKTSVQKHSRPFTPRLDNKYIK